MKFKVGDWIRSKDGTDISRVGIDTIKWYEEIEDKDIVNEWELWQPQPGELVILKDKNSIISIIKYNGEANVYPFIGEITWLHKKD